MKDEKEYNTKEEELLIVIVLLFEKTNTRV